MDVFYSPNEPIIKYRKKLPHWRQNNKIYFVTFRLKDSIPAKKWKQYQRWMKSLEHYGVKCYPNTFHISFEKWLDSEYGSCIFKWKEVAQIIENALQYNQNKAYFLDAYVIAANHVHLLVQPMEGHVLHRIVWQWKSSTAHMIIKQARKGFQENVKPWKHIYIQLEKARLKHNWSRIGVWQQEYFDHIVRNKEKLIRFRKYIQFHSGYKKIYLNRKT